MKVPGTCSAARLYHNGKWSALNTSSLSSAVSKSLTRKHTQSTTEYTTFITALLHCNVRFWQAYSLNSWSGITKRLTRDRPVRVPRKAISTPLSEFLEEPQKTHHEEICNENIKIQVNMKLELDVSQRSISWQYALCSSYSDLLRARLVQYASSGAVTTASNRTSWTSSLSPTRTARRHAWHQPRRSPTRLCASELNLHLICSSPLKYSFMASIWDRKRWSGCSAVLQYVLKVTHVLVLYSTVHVKPLAEMSWDDTSPFIC